MAERVPFWLLAALLCIVFFTGGSTWDSEPQLMALRSVAFLIAGIAILTLRWEHIARHWIVWALFLGAAFLTASHLVPLPYAWWSAMPGREIIVEIDQLAGIGQISRPLSMSPDATLNALYALGVPMAVLVLAVQLKVADHQRILLLLLGLAGLSGLFGVLQAGGSDVTFYPAQTPTSGLFANRNHQGALLALLIPMAACAGAVGFGGRGALFARVAVPPAGMVIATSLLLVTGSRSGLVVAAVGLMFALLIRSSEQQRDGRAWWQRLALPVTMAASTGGLVWIAGFAARDVAIDRLGSTEDDLRWTVWQSIIEMLPHYMPWGTGIGSYAQAYQVLEPDRLLRPTISNHAHNEFLEVALTAGIPGLALIGLAATALLLSLWRAFYGKARQEPTAIFSRLGAGMIVLLAIASTTDYPTRTPILAAIFALAAVWASLGAQAAGCNNSDQGLT